MSDSQQSRLAASQILGEAAWLYSQSTLHRSWPVRIFAQLVIPAVMSGNIRIFHDQGRPVGMVTWTYLSADVETAYARNPLSLQPRDWNSGDRLWCIDFIAPFGHAQKITKTMRNNLFKNETARALRPYKNSSGVRIVYLHGADAIAKARDYDSVPAVEI